MHPLLAGILSVFPPGLCSHRERYPQHLSWPRDDWNQHWFRSGPLELITKVWFPGCLACKSGGFLEVLRFYFVWSSTFSEIISPKSRQKSKRNPKCLKVKHLGFWRCARWVSFSRLDRLGNGKSQKYSYLRSAINRSTLYAKIFHFSVKVAKGLTKSKN